MPPDLLKAHKALDKAVINLYGLPKDATESEILEKLISMQTQLLKEEKLIKQKQKQELREKRKLEKQKIRKHNKNTTQKQNSHKT